jgi:hypothetical protein
MSEVGSGGNGAVTARRARRAGEEARESPEKPVAGKKRCGVRRVGAAWRIADIESTNPAVAAIRRGRLALAPKRRLAHVPFAV